MLNDIDKAINFLECYKLDSKRSLFYLEEAERHIDKYKKLAMRTGITSMKKKSD